MTYQSVIFMYDFDLRRISFIIILYLSSYIVCMHVEFGDTLFNKQIKTRYSLSKLEH